MVARVFTHFAADGADVWKKSLLLITFGGGAGV